MFCDWGRKLFMCVWNENLLVKSKKNSYKKWSMKKWKIKNVLKLCDVMNNDFEH